jgi:hypothetical protein
VVGGGEWHRNLKSRSRIKPRKVKQIGRKSMKRYEHPKTIHVGIEYYALENCGV